MNRPTPQDTQRMSDRELEDLGAETEAGGRKHYNVVFTFTDLRYANDFMQARHDEGWVGIIVDADTGEEVEL